jgi:hypothetical protein
MDHQNHYAYFAGSPPHPIDKTKQYDDCVDTFFECLPDLDFVFRSRPHSPLDSSPCAAAQGCDDEFPDATQAQAGTKLFKTHLARVYLRFVSFILEPFLQHCSELQLAHRTQPQQ